MDDPIAVVFRGGPFDGRLDAVPLVSQPRYLDTDGGGWALYALTEEQEGDLRICRYRHGSESAA
jgi:hypothetical protein